MCIFCAAIPVAAATGANLNGRQLKAKRKAQEAGLEKPHTKPKPVAQVTAGLILLLMLCSVTYHKLMALP